MPPLPEDALPETTEPGGGRAGSWTLEIPPDAVYISTARLFAAAVARQFGVDEEAVDDLKVAISEACTGAIRVRESGSVKGPVRIHVSSDGGSLRFEIEDAIEPGPSLTGATTADLARGLGIELIQALFPGGEMVPGRRGATSVRLFLPLGANGPGTTNA